MKLNRTVLAVITLSALIVPPAFAAESCTTFRGVCLSSYTGTDQTGAERKCTAAAKDCQERCRKGQKIFVGPINGAHHPVDTCG